MPRKSSSIGKKSTVRRKKINKGTPKSWVLPVRKIIGLLFFSIGILLLSIQGARIYYRITYKPTPVAKVETIKYPKYIQIPSINVALPIVQNDVLENEWKVDPFNVNHLVTSSVPGKGGNIVLYGHNTKEVLGNLRRMKVKDIITISVEDGMLYTYTVNSIKRVKPNDVSILAPTDIETITIYTCIGFLDSHRLVITATPTSL